MSAALIDLFCRSSLLLAILWLSFAAVGRFGGSAAMKQAILMTGLIALLLLPLLAALLPPLPLPILPAAPEIVQPVASVSPPESPLPASSAG